MTNTGTARGVTITGVTDLVTSDATQLAEIASDAVRSARAAATRSGVEMRELETVADLSDVAALLDQIWNAEPGHPQVATELLRAFAVAGGYVVGAYDEAQLLGVCVGFAEPPNHRSLHSHIAGVHACARGRDIGFALKVHQRAWAIARGFETISWTFDPLIRRNAYFNLGKLGASPQRYIPDFYGPMTDGINRADASDRLYLRWQLKSAGVRRRCGDPGTAADLEPADFDRAVSLLRPDDLGGVVRTSDPAATHVVVDLPADAERLRREDPLAAQRWRLELRDVLLQELDAGGSIVGFDRAKGYLIQRGAPA